jgi:mitogen-activated protein kinase 15
MLLGKPLFQGTSTFNQLERILQHIPTPSQSDIASIASHYGPSVLERASSVYRFCLFKKIEFEFLPFFLIRQKKSLENLIPNANEEALDLLRRLLHFNPDKRVTAEEGLRHPFVVSYVFFLYLILFLNFILY